MGALTLGLAMLLAPLAQAGPPKIGTATDEYVPPPPPTHDENGYPYCGTPEADAAAAEARKTNQPSICAQRPLKMVLGEPTKGSPWQVELLSTFRYTADVVAQDSTVRAAEGRTFLSEKADWERRHRCGGALIAPDLVLTAAHCVAPGDNGDVRRSRAVRVGANNLSTGEGRIVRISHAVVHPGYDPKTAANDIALLRLGWGKKMPLYPTIRLAGPGQPDATPGREVTVTGWGLTAAREPDSRSLLTRTGAVNHASAQLQELWLTVQDPNSCARLDKLRAATEAGAICALAVTKDADSCQGDSGGPLVLAYLSWTGPKRILVGIVSQGVGCAWQDTPALYTRVSQYRDWIASAAKATGSRSALR